MKRYCLDTSGFSNPLETTPEDIHASLWGRMIAMIESGALACTAEVYEELTHLPGGPGKCICDCEARLVLDVDNNDWDGEAFIENVVDLQHKYEEYISEYNEYRRYTVGLIDISIIALAKTLQLPLISMESAVNNEDSKKRRIPDICLAEGIQHLTFNEMLRREGHVI